MFYWRRSILISYDLTELYAIEEGQKLHMDHTTKLDGSMITVSFLDRPRVSPTLYMSMWNVRFSISRVFQRLTRFNLHCYLFSKRAHHCVIPTHIAPVRIFENGQLA